MWSTSSRRSRLPGDWASLRMLVKERAGGRCEANHHALRCNGVGTDADHIKQGDNHDLSNLQWLSRPCHDAKTARETAARNRQTAALKRRPVEQHPGRRTTT